MLPGLDALQAQTLGDPRVCVAVLDGPVDLTHLCFAGADLRPLPTLAGGEVGTGAMSLHGTHVASLVFGQPGSPIPGIAPRCRGLIVPVFRDGEVQRASQLDLARAIEQALGEGADVISISGGERSPTVEAQAVLERALRRCADAGVLVVAAVGNDGCDCVQVPAAVGSVLAVGACDANGTPLASNNWGEAFQTNGVLAPGQHIDGAAPGGGREARTGSSFATPVVAATAALLLSTQLDAEPSLRPVDAGAAIFASAIPCPVPADAGGCRRHLGGRLDVGRALELITQKGNQVVDDPTEATVNVSGPTTAYPSTAAPAQSPAGGPDPHPSGAVIAAGSGAPHPVVVPTPAPAGAPPALPAPLGPPGGYPGAPALKGVQPAEASCGCGGSGDAGGLIYAIGTIGFDFGTEARRDGFRQQMDPSVIRDDVYPANPHDSRQLARYLTENPWASDKLIWTLELDRTPIYALRAEPAMGMVWDGFQSITTGDDGQPVDLSVDVAFPDRLATIMRNFMAVQPVSYVYRTFRDAIVGQTLDPKKDDNYVSRVSIPAVMTDQTVRLFSGQVVPLVEVKARGLATWNEPALITAAIDSVIKNKKYGEAMAQRADDPAGARANLEKNVRAFLDKVYYQFRNLGQSSPDRALNYAGTNAFVLSQDLFEGLTSGTYVPGVDQPLYALDTINVTKSPYCRMDSDCWDVVVTFFDPADDRRSNVSYLYTIDVSAELPVSLAPSHQFLGN